MFGYLVRLIVRIFESILKGVIQIILNIIRWLIPRVASILVSTSLISLISARVGFRESSERLADHWMERLNNIGMSVGYDTTLRTGAVIMASATLIFGWLVISSLVILFIGVLFYH